MLYIFTNKFNFNGLEHAVEQLKGKPVYLSIDLDVLDPSIFPGTGTPEAGGVSFSELLNAILTVSGLNIVACDVNELCPVYDQSGVSTAVACKILRELLLSLSK
jgi:agmatinase